MKYFYLGLEAKVRENNKFTDECSLMDAAKHAAKKNGTPIRIFVMDECNKSHLWGVVDPDGKLVDKMYKPITFYPEEEAHIRSIFDTAVEKIKVVPLYNNIYRVHGLEAAVKHFLNNEEEHSEFMFKAIKQIVGDLDLML